MAFKPISNRALCAVSALLGLVSISAPAAAQYYSAFPGATYSQPQLPRRGQAPDIFRDPRRPEEDRYGRVQTAGFWPESYQGAQSYEPRAARVGGTRQLVSDPTGQPSGAITVDTRVRKLYLSLGGGQAIEYGIGVGRRGFEWRGVAQVGRKASWPGWTPPPEMLRRRPDLPRHMNGGMDNPLGARALYLYRGGKDTMFRIHGTNEPDTIGQAVSSGCIRMMNADVIDLYQRVGTGTRVVVN
jgi:lipoprotein-anchoring transpeptidase ErfK/SrfK